MGGSCLFGKDGCAGRIAVGESMIDEKAKVKGEYSGGRTEVIVCGRWIPMLGSSGKGGTVPTMLKSVYYHSYSGMFVPTVPGVVFHGCV